MVHLAIMGPPKSGKTHVASTISSLHKRAHVKLDEVIDWVTQTGSELATKITTYLEDRQKDL